MPDIPSIVSALGWAPWALIPLYFIGAATAVDAVMKARTPQGATAWVFALVALPLLALPLYWILGRFKFDDYVDALRVFEGRVSEGGTDDNRESDGDGVDIDRALGRHVGHKQRGAERRSGTSTIRRRSLVS